MKKLFLIILICIFPWTLVADFVDERKVDIYVANGMSTSQPYAVEHAELVRNAVIKITFNGNFNEYTTHIGKVKESYNTTFSNEENGEIWDGLESVFQKLGLQGLVDLFFETAHERDLHKQVDAYMSSIKSGHGVLVVAESQGNFFTHEAYNDIEDWMQNYFEVVSVSSPMTFPIKPGTPAIAWDNDWIPNFGIYTTNTIENPIRKITWSPYDDSDLVAEPTVEYVYKNQIDKIYKNAWRASDFGWNDFFATKIHFFPFYMGKPLNKYIYSRYVLLNPFDGKPMQTDLAKNAILEAIEQQLTKLQNQPSQWQVVSNENTNVCEERRAKLVHFQDAVAPIDVAYPFNMDKVTIDDAERYNGKVYQVPDVNGTDRYVLASNDGTQIVDVEDQGLILDDSGNDVGCYQLDGTGDQIVKGCSNTKPTDGVLEVDLSWKSPDIDLTLSVIKEDVEVGDLDKIEQCPKRHWYIATEADVTEGTYFVHIDAEDVANIDAALLPETVKLKIDAPGGGLKISIPIPSADLLNIGAVAKIIVTKPEGGGVDVAVEVTKHPDVEYTAERYQYDADGTAYNYEAVSLLNIIELGPIANAQIEIMSLSASDFGQVVYSGYTSSGDALDTNGLMLLPPSFKQSVTSDGLYLISATGGEDVDTDDDLNMDATPTTNFGTIHAIVSGADIKENGLKVNILTELGYQVSKELLLNAEDALGTLTKLDEAAQALLIEDMNKDGVIDRHDFQSWIPSFDKAMLKFDYDSAIHPIVLKIYNADDIYDDVQNLLYPNIKPVANAGEDLSINFGESVTLDGSGSYDSDGYIAEYLWYKDGTIYCKSNTSECTVEGLTAGYNVFELVVKDDKGAVGRDSVKVFVDSHGVLLGSYDTNSYALRVTLSPDGTLAYITDASGGLYLIDINQPAEPYLIKHLATSGNTWGIDLSEDGTTAYVADIFNGLEIIDVTNPLEAQRVGRYSNFRSARDVVVSTDGSVAYVLDYYNGLQIIDISNWTSPSLIGSYTAWGYAYRLTLSSDGNIAYVAYSGSGLQIVDITNPTAPVLISEYRGTYVYGVTVSPDGNTAYLANGNNGVRIIDISDPKNPFFIGRYDTPGFARNVALSKSGNVLYVADDFRGVQILDISNPEELTLIGSFYSGQAYDVALSSDDTILYIAGYTRGLQVIDVSAFKH